MPVEISLGEVDTPRHGTFLRGERWVSLTVDGRTVLFNGAVASALSQAMWDIARRSAHGEQRPPRTEIFTCTGELLAAPPVQNGDERPEIHTCPKCGAKAAAFICSEPGCPVNGGAAYG